MPANRPTTREERAKHVAQTNANFRIEGFEPDAQDIQLQQEYIEGTKTLDDLLNYAKAFATKNAPK